MDCTYRAVPRGRSCDHQHRCQAHQEEILQEKEDESVPVYVTIWEICFHLCSRYLFCTRQLSFPVAAGSMLCGRSQGGGFCAPVLVAEKVQWHMYTLSSASAQLTPLAISESKKGMLILGHLDHIALDRFLDAINAHRGFLEWSDL